MAGREPASFGVRMATKKMLLATADLQTVVDVNDALGDEWTTIHVATEAEALAELEDGSFDALLVDFNIGEPDGSEVLNQALEKCPDVTRFLFACEADLALVAAKVVGDHEILPKPVAVESLKSRIERGMSDPRLNDEGVATGFDNASSIPPVYSEVIQALQSPEVTSKQVGAIIASDAQLMQEVLKLTKSAYLGVRSNVSDPAEAVELLGLETVKALVMALQFLAEHSHVRPAYLSLESIWQHSTSVAQIARDLVLFETKDRAQAAQAFAAGLVHDLGKVVLATNFDDLYGRVHSLARKQPVALWEIEKEMFGASHGEIGACLLGMWNLSPAVVEAAAFHHEPPLGEQNHLTPLAAVHIANVLAHQLQPSEEFRVAPVVNTPFLNQLGLLQRLPIWRATFANQLSRDVSPEEIKSGWGSPALAAESASQTGNRLPGPAAETWTSTSTTTGGQRSLAGQSTRAWPQHWFFTGVAAVVLLSLALFFRLEVDRNDPTPVHARPFANNQTVAAAAAPLVPDASASDSLVVEVAPEDLVATVLPEVKSVAADASANPAAVPEISGAVVSEPVNTQSSPEVIPVIIPEPAVPVAERPSLLAQDVEKPAFRLNGIFYSVTKPSAIINGKAVCVGDVVSGATVISVGRSAVVLEVDGERKTLSIRSAD